MKKQEAFSLLEILVVVVVIGIMATMALPRLGRKAPKTEWKNVIDEINNLVDYARQEAIANQNIYRLRFISKKTSNDLVQVEIERDNPEKPGQKLYEPIKSYYFKPVYKLPEVITIFAVYHGKTEQFAENKDNAYCYIIPNGLVQEIFVHMERIIREEKSQMTLKMSPFFGKFELLEGFIKPRQR